MASMFTFGIATGFAAASMVAVVGSAPAAAQLGWDQSTAPIKYLQYDLPYSKSPLVPIAAYAYSRPEHRLAFGSVQLRARQCRRRATNGWGWHSVHQLRPNTVLELVAYLNHPMESLNCGWSLPVNVTPSQAFLR
jgi:hypothetical protein